MQVHLEAAYIDQPPGRGKRALIDDGGDGLICSTNDGEAADANSQPQRDARLPALFDKLTQR